MELNKDIATIHAYLCGDGYVVKNPETQKVKYYRVGLRNINIVLLEDFYEIFERFFGVKPHIREGRCEKGSREIYEKLTEKFGSFYSREWTMPKLNDELSKAWLRAFFDCEGWVTCKSHQNRHIGLDSVNEKGLDQVIDSLEKLGIGTIKKKNKKRNIYRIYIFGKDNLASFKKQIDFLHPDKKRKLEVVLDDYVVYKWNFPKEKEARKEFLKGKVKEKLKTKKPYYVRMVSKEHENLKNIKSSLKEFYGVNCNIYKCVNGLGTVFYELSVSRKEEIQKLINANLIQDIIKKSI